MSNTNLIHAKRQKNDEFYTQLRDIEKEMQAYLEYDPDVFRDKTVLLPCDDPTWSNFTKYFALNFESLGLKKLISTSYSPSGGHGKVLTLDGEETQRGYLEGDGDFRSTEVTALRDEADMVITNPPFSLFREFMAWLNEDDVLFSVIGNMNAITYKGIFPLIKNNELWIGATGMRSITYEVPVEGDVGPGQFEENGKRYQKMGNTCWFTNIEHGRRHEPLKLMTQAENQKYNKRIINNANSYKKYDNYDAIEVPVTAGIPSDYTGVMGVPISSLDKYCPEQFEIVSLAAGNSYANTPPEVLKFVKFVPHVPGSEGAGQGVPVAQGKKVYARILIRHINPAEQDVIEVPVTAGIPSGHSGVMGVPISFLDKYCPEQFEIVGMQSSAGYDAGIVGIPMIGSGDARPTVNGKNTYARIFIRHINPAIQEADVHLAQVHTLETATPEPQQMAA